MPRVLDLDPRDVQLDVVVGDEHVSDWPMYTARVRRGPYDVGVEQHVLALHRVEPVAPFEESGPRVHSARTRWDRHAVAAEHLSASPGVVLDREIADRETVRHSRATPARLRLVLERQDRLVHAMADHGDIVDRERQNAAHVERALAERDRLAGLDVDQRLLRDLRARSGRDADARAGDALCTGRPVLQASMRSRSTRGGCIEGGDRHRIGQTVKEMVSPMRLPKELQLARLVSEAPEGDDWLHEQKFDGYRIVAVKDGDDVRLVAPLKTARAVPGVAAAVAALKTPRAIPDGESRCCCPTGGTSFSRAAESQRAPSSTTCSI